MEGLRKPRMLPRQEWAGAGRGVPPPPGRLLGQHLAWPSHFLKLEKQALRCEAGGALWGLWAGSQEVVLGLAFPCWQGGGWGLGGGSEGNPTPG